MARAKTDRNEKLPSKVGGGDTNWMTDYQTEDDTSLDHLGQYRVIPRLKVVQAMSAEELKDAIGEGGVCITPGNILLVKKGESVDLVPIFCFTEFCLWSDPDDSAANTILDRTFDPTSELAKKARDPDARLEFYGEDEKLKMKYVEHLNFACIIYSKDHEQVGTPVTLQFSRGEFSKGRAFASACMLRKIDGKTVPLWAQIWTINTSLRKRGGQKKWFGIDFSAPDIPYITQDEADFFKGEHEATKEDYAAKRLIVDVGDGNDPVIDPDAPGVEM